MEPIVIYHKNCPDGFCAAYIAKKAIPDAILVDANYGDPIPDVKNRDVYILDFSYSRDDMVKLCAENRVTIIDHHKTSMENLESLQNCTLIFDMSHSGAYLAWEYFMDGEMPMLVRYIEDRDIWKWQLPHSKEINNAIGLYEKTMEGWDPLFSTDDIIDRLKEQGELLEKSKQLSIKTHMARASLTSISGYNVPTANCSNTEIVSDMLHAMCKGHAFAAAFNVFDDGVKFSLRSEGDFDVASIAKRYGGGGHKNAAGFQLDKEVGAEFIRTGQV